MRISDWSADVCSSDLVGRVGQALVAAAAAEAQRVGPGVLAVVGESRAGARAIAALGVAAVAVGVEDAAGVGRVLVGDLQDRPGARAAAAVRVHGMAADGVVQRARSEEHTSELQSIMSISYAVC